VVAIKTGQRKLFLPLLIRHWWNCRKRKLETHQIRWPVLSADFYWTMPVRTWSVTRLFHIYTGEVGSC
jgi:hypothetical protein